MPTYLLEGEPECNKLLLITGYNMPGLRAWNYMYVVGLAPVAVNIQRCAAMGHHYLWEALNTVVTRAVSIAVG